MGDFAGTEKDIKNKIGIRRAQSNRIVAKGFSYPEGAIAEGDLAGLINLADDIGWFINNWR